MLADAKHIEVGRALQRLYMNDPRKEESDEDLKLVAGYIQSLRRQLDEKCFVLPDGQCVSLYECPHGPPFPIEDAIADMTYMNWLSANLVYMIVKVIGYQAETLPNNGKGWAGNELRQALSKAIERQNEYNHIRKEGTPR
jgi:hypothetical protein